MAAAAGDAHPFPIFNARFRAVFPILNNTGSLVTAAAGLDSEASQDQGTFADCTNEATEIATSSGVYYLDLVAGEMDTQSTAVIVKTSTTDAKTTLLTFYPRRLPVVRTGTAQAGAASTITLDSGASAADSFYVGCWVNITNNSPANVQGQARQITAYVGSTKVATVDAVWGTNPSSASTFEILCETASSVVEWAGVPVVDPTAAGRPNVNATHLSNTSLTARDIGASVLLSPGTGTGQISLASGAVTAGTVSDKTGYALTQTFPTNFSAMAINASGHVILQDASLVTAKLGTFALAKTTNITGFNDIAATAIVSSGAITTSGGSVSTVTTTTTATNLTNLPTIPANWLTAAGIAAAALNGKGDWNIGKTGYALTATTGLGNQTADITGSLSGSVGSVTGAVGSVTAAVTVGTISANVVTASALATDAVNEIADGLLSRNVSNVEASAGEHTLCTVILASLEGSRSGTTWLIKRTDGSTTHATKTLTTDAAAELVTGVT
jgi:hypothetical protein